MLGSPSLPSKGADTRWPAGIWVIPIRLTTTAVTNAATTKRHACFRSVTLFTTM